MGPRLITAAFSLSLLLPVLPAIAIAQQSPTVWVDAKGNVHSSPPEVLPTDALPPKGENQSLPSSVQPGYPTVNPSLPARNTEPGPTATRGIHYVPWQDPAEGAFSVSLPEGWQISGGTVRTTRAEIHFVVHAQSPDGAVHLFLDSPRMAHSQSQDQAVSAASLYMGPVMPATVGANLPLVPYRPGDQFAALYAQQLLCPTQANVKGGPLVRQSQDLTRLLAPIAESEEATIQADAGEVSFRCGQRIGYVYALTVNAQQSGKASPRWAVYRLAGYLATPAQATLAARTVNRMLATFQIDPAWLQNYEQEIADTAGNLLRESDAISESMKGRAQAMHLALQASLTGAHSEVASISGVPAPAANTANGNGYTAHLQTRKVCDELDRCQTVGMAIDKWYSDCSGRFYPGPVSGGPPPADLSACWLEGH